MEDREIVELFFARREQALDETRSKFGASLLALARRIVGNPSDAEECESDVYLCAWKKIPPDCPYPVDFEIDYIRVYKKKALP